MITSALNHNCNTQRTDVIGHLPGGGFQVMYDNPHPGLTTRSEFDVNTVISSVSHLFKQPLGH